MFVWMHRSLDAGPSAAYATLIRRIAYVCLTYPCYSSQKLHSSKVYIGTSSICHPTNAALTPIIGLLMSYSDQVNLMLPAKCTQNTLMTHCWHGTRSTHGTSSNRPLKSDLLSILWPTLEATIPFEPRTTDGARDCISNHEVKCTDGRIPRRLLLYFGLVEDRLS